MGRIYIYPLPVKNAYKKGLINKNMIGTYNFPAHRRGDTFGGQLFSFREEINDVLVPIDLTGTSIILQLKILENCKFSFEFSTENLLITLPDPAMGQVYLESTIIDILEGLYLYDMQITFPDGVVRTWIKGNWPITKRISR